MFMSHDTTGNIEVRRELSRLIQILSTLRRPVSRWNDPSPGRSPWAGMGRQRSAQPLIANVTHCVQTLALLSRGSHLLWCPARATLRLRTPGTDSVWRNDRPD